MLARTHLLVAAPQPMPLLWEQATLLQLAIARSAAWQQPLPYAPGIGTRAWGTSEDGTVVEISSGTWGADELTPYWPPTGLVCSFEPPNRKPDRVLAIDATPAGWTRFESDLSLFTAEHLHGRVAIHASVSMWRDRAILVPGHSMAGKSTLGLALSEAGAVLLSDEYALVEPATGFVTGWARPARRRQADGSVARIALEAPPAGPIPVSLVAAVRFDPTETVALQRMGERDTVTELLANTVSAQQDPRSALRAAAAVARAARGIRGTRHEAHEAVAQLLSESERARS